MSKLKSKIFSILASIALLLNLAVLPGSAYADVSCSVSGNGSDSSSSCTFTSSSNVNVNQNNDLVVDNNVNVDADTGNNMASGNTGGDVDIDTGSADVDIVLETMANKNVAHIEDSAPQDFDLEIEDNGTDSSNDVDIDATRNISLNQDNVASVNNNVDVTVNTGNNEADDNTDGDVRVRTGDASVNHGVHLNTSVNLNQASVGTDNGHDGQIDARISGNGSDSSSLIDLALLSDVEINQINDAFVENDVNIDVDSGNNTADANTGGNVDIDTGDADVDVWIDTMANFNAAHAEDAFDGHFDLEIDDNGTGSSNDIDLDLTDDTNANQDNILDLGNDVDEIANTGNNDASDNTDGDAEIRTGNSLTDIMTFTQGNVNGLFSEVEFDFDLDDLFDFLHH